MFFSLLSNDVCITIVVDGRGGWSFDTGFWAFTLLVIFFFLLQQSNKRK